MKRVYLTVFLTVFTCVVLATSTEKLQCFHFTWPGATVSKPDDFDNNDNNNSYCEDYNENNPFTPCIEPVIFGQKKPDLTKIWESKTHIKPMEPGSVCVKFTYVYNGAVVNVSYFRGKVTEDQTTPVTSGCYVQYTEGYSIEACACQSESGSRPCNSTTRNTYSLLITFVTAAVLLFMYKIFEIP